MVILVQQPALLACFLIGRAMSTTRSLWVSLMLLVHESVVTTNTHTDSLLETMISLVDTSKSGKTGNATKIAIQFLLDTPIETLSRPQREAIMKALVAHLPEESDKVKTIGPEYWRPVLSLMVKLMSRPTFYEVRLAFV